MPKIKKSVIKLIDLLFVLWTGMMWMSAIAAQIIFGTLKNKTLAGTLAGKLFTLATYAGFFIILLLLGMFIYKKRKRVIKYARFYFYVSMVSLLSVNQFILHPMIASLRANPGYRKVPELKTQFVISHTTATLIYIAVTLGASALCYKLLKGRS